MTARHLATAFLLAAIAAGVGAKDLYQWVDDRGQVQFGDRPPAKPARNVKKMAVPDAPVSPVQPHTREPSRATQTPHNSTATDPRPEPGRGAAEASLPPRGSPEDCRAWRQEYLRSHACYGQFRNARGGIKAEAFAVCGPEVLDPAVECGPPVDPSGGPRR